MQVTMKDRVAVVTGGSKGIGLAVARQFAASGAKVAILARGAADLKAARELLAKDGIEVRDYVCDVSKASDIAKAHEKITADLGPVDILVNNAGTARTMAFENISDEAWQEDLDLKLFAAIRFSRLVWPGMKARKWGRIINVLNTYAKAPAASSAPDLGIAGGRHGADQGDGWRRRRAQHSGQCHAGRPDHERSMGASGTRRRRRRWISRCLRKTSPRARPLGRIGTAEEFANLACFLASEQGSFITGTAINVDGGRSPVV